MINPREVAPHFVFSVAVHFLAAVVLSGGDVAKSELKHWAPASPCIDTNIRSETNGNVFVLKIHAVNDNAVPIEPLNFHNEFPGRIGEGSISIGGRTEDLDLNDEIIWSGNVEARAVVDILLAGKGTTEVPLPTSLFTGRYSTLDAKGRIQVRPIGVCTDAEIALRKYFYAVVCLTSVIAIAAITYSLLKWRKGKKTPPKPQSKGPEIPTTNSL